MLTPLNNIDKVAEGVEDFFSMQRQTLQMAFENLERSRISRYESLSRTQIPLHNATETIGRQILTNQLAVRKSINQAFHLKLPKTIKQWDTLQQNFSNCCENVLKQIDHSVVMTKRVAEQSQKAESTLQQLAQHFLNEHIDSIQKKVSTYYNLSFSDMVSTRRFINIARPRQIAMYLCKGFTSYSYPEIGNAFGGKDHTTVIHAVKKIETMLEIDQKLKKQIFELKESILTP